MARQPRVAIRLIAALCGLVGAGTALAYESDQYSNRLLSIADARPALNRLVDEALIRVVAQWRGPANKPAFARAVFWQLGGLHWVDPIERWVMESHEIERLPRLRRRGIFTGSSPFHTRVNFVFGVGQTFRLADARVGSDKLGHFFSQGMKYYQSHIRGASELEVMSRGRVNERLIFGQLTTGVYSNADLVANYEGYLFYRGLFEPGIVAGKPALVLWRAGRPVVQRPFDWADHVNDYWDEALNPSFYGRGLQRFMNRKLPELCGEYRRDPAAFKPRNEAELERRYATIGMRPAPRNRVDRVCEAARLRAVDR